jgi:GNAT superfamily N-acetyltransferase
MLYNQKTGLLIELVRVEELDTVCELFERAIEFQKQNNYIGWTSIDRSFVLRDIESSLLLKVCNEEQIFGFFCICYSDELIWREMEKADAIYLHRIVLNQAFRGEKIFKHILDWAKETAKQKNLKYIRMDTWAENEKLINYYKSYGFVFTENYRTADTPSLPIQHRNLNVALLQYAL